MVQLIDADDVDLKTGALTYAAPFDRPYDWALAGDKRFFFDMVTPAGLAEIKTYADAIGPWKRYIVTPPWQSMITRPRCSTSVIWTCCPRRRQTLPIGLQCRK